MPYDFYKSIQISQKKISEPPSTLVPICKPFKAVDQKWLFNWHLVLRDSVHEPVQGLDAFRRHHPSPIANGLHQLIISALLIWKIWVCRTNNRHVTVHIWMKNVANHTLVTFRAKKIVIVTSHELWWRHTNLLTSQTGHVAELRNKGHKFSRFTSWNQF